MLTFTSQDDYVQSGKTRRSIEVSKVSMGSGKSSYPRIRRHSCSYVNRFNSFGSAEIVTEIRSIKGENTYQIRVAKRGINGEPVIVYSRRVDAQKVISYILEDMRTSNHRLYVAESPGRSRDGKNLEFADGISILFRGLERMLGISLNSQFIDLGNKVGCRTSFPTLQKIVFGQAARHNKVRRQDCKTASMPTDNAGGAKLPSLKEQIGRSMIAAKRNLEWAEEALNQEKTDEAEYRFQTACEYEAKASEARSIIINRAALLRERVAHARAKKAAKKVENAA